MPTPNTPAAKILVVDDEASIRMLLREILFAEGYTVITAGDGREALPMTLKDQYDLIITDIRMPQLDGLTLCKALRKNEVTKDIPVLILTGLSAPEHLRDALEAGADDFLPKPLNVDEIKLRVRALLRLKRALDEVRQLRAQLAKQPA